MFKSMSFALLLSVFIAQLALADSATDLENASNKIDSAAITFQKLQDNGSISFATPQSETEYTKALLALQSGLRILKEAKSGASSDKKLELILEEAFLLQKILGAYLGNNEIFGYHLKEDDEIQVAVSAGGVFEAVSKRVPFLGAVIGGSVKIRVGSNIVTQFNQLKTEFYGVLVRAAHIDKKDSRTKALAKWGNETKVIYPGESFGKEIIETSQLWDLGLE